MLKKIILSSILLITSIQAAGVYNGAHDGEAMPPLIPVRVHQAGTLSPIPELAAVPAASTGNSSAAHSGGTEGGEPTSRSDIAQTPRLGRGFAGAPVAAAGLPSAPQGPRAQEAVYFAPGAVIFMPAGTAQNLRGRPYPHTRVRREVPIIPLGQLVGSRPLSRGREHAPLLAPRPTSEHLSRDRAAAVTGAPIPDVPQRTVAAAAARTAGEDLARSPQRQMERTRHRALVRGLRQPRRRGFLGRMGQRVRMILRRFQPRRQAVRPRIHPAPRAARAAAGAQDLPPVRESSLLLAGEVAATSAPGAPSALSGSVRSRRAATDVMSADEGRASPSRFSIGRGLTFQRRESFEEQGLRAVLEEESIEDRRLRRRLRLPRDEFYAMSHAERQLYQRRLQAAHQPASQA